MTISVILRLTVASLLVCAAQPAVATCTLPEPPPAPASSAPALTRASYDLAQLYYPEDMIMAVVERSARDGFEQAMRQQPGGDQIIREHPGLVDAGYQATMRVLRRCAPRIVGVLQHSASQLFARELSPAHVGAIADFYRSDTGRATMAAVVQTMRPPEIRLRADGTPEPITGADVRQAIGTGFMDILTPAQIRGLAAFGQSAHGQAFMRIAPQLERMTISSMNATNTAMAPEIEAEVGAAVSAYMARQGNARQ